MVRALALHQCGSGSIPGPGVISVLVEFVLVLDPVPRVFLRALRFSSFSKSGHAAYSSWLLCFKVMYGPYSGYQRLPAAPIYAFSPNLSSCIFALFAEMAEQGRGQGGCISPERKFGVLSPPHFGAENIASAA